MSQYRIKKTEITNGLGRTTTYYTIQKKFLFFWITAYVKMLRYSWAGECSQQYTSLVNLQLDSLEDCELVINHLQNPYKETYFGDNLERILTEKLKPIYINWSRTTQVNWWHQYHVSYDLEELKQNIARWQTSKKSSIIER